MSQHDFEIANQGFPATRADLNNALQALASNSAGATEPSSTYAYQFWYDETTDLLKLRNSDDDAWITLAAFDQTNDEWEVRSAVIQAVDSAGVVIKTDDGTTRIEVQDDGDVSIDSGTLFVDASNNRVGINQTSPATLLDINDDINGEIGLIIANASNGTNAGSLLRFFCNSDTERANIIRFPSGHSSKANQLFITNVGTTSPITFATQDTERMRIDSSGHLIVPNGVTLGTAVGTYSAANTLDDYEEGTWTPTVTFTSGGATISVASSVCQYTKVGRLVHVSGRFTLTSLSGSPAGDLVIGSLPFTVNDPTGDGNRAGIQVYFENPASDIGYDIVGLPFDNTTGFYVRKSGIDGSPALGSAVDAGTSFLFGGAYAAA